MSKMPYTTKILEEIDKLLDWKCDFMLGEGMEQNLKFAKCVSSDGFRNDVFTRYRNYPIVDYKDSSFYAVEDNNGNKKYITNGKYVNGYKSRPTIEYKFEIVPN